LIPEASTDAPTYFAILSYFYNLFKCLAFSLKLYTKSTERIYRYEKVQETTEQEYSPYDRGYDMTVNEARERGQTEKERR
jgi:hypothetical protein